jgi:hypothetical protein
VAEFLIVKKDDTQPLGFRPVTVVTANVPTTLEEGREIAKQGYDGPGGYRVVRWDNGKGYRLGDGPVEAVDEAV